MKKIIKKILIIKTSSMGDIIHTLPAVTDAGHALPNAEFDWVIEKQFSQIPIWHPKIKTIISTNFRTWKKQYHQLETYKSYLKFIRQLQNKTYDIIIDAQGLIKSAFLVTYFAKGEKHGMNFNSIREPIAHLCYNKTHQISKTQHAIKRIRQLFSLSLQYPFPTNKDEYSILHHFKTKKNISPYLIFLHNTTHSKKNWPKHNWRELLKIAIQSGYQIKLAYWSTSEQIRTQKITQGLKAIIILPRPTLTEIAKQIASASAVISIDTGLSHLTTALARPNLTLYGPTNPQLIGIYGYKQQQIHSKTNQMHTITPQTVWEKFQTLLKQ